MKGELESLLISIGGMTDAWAVFFVKKEWAIGREKDGKTPAKYIIKAPSRQ